MIHVDNATLRVRKIRQSRNGPFCVADLYTEFGEFKVKEAILDQFDEGEYKADVWISEIFLGSYVSYGKSVTEIRARVHDLRVITADEGSLVAEPVIEPDPLDEAPSLSVQMPAPEANNGPPDAAAAPDTGLAALKKRFAHLGSRPLRSAKAPAVPHNAVPEATAATLQGPFDDESWALIQSRQPVKLDATDRARLRIQTGAMSDHNYKFNSLQQTWYPL